RDIIVGGGDMYVYAWDGFGHLLHGFPVKAQDTSISSPVGRRIYNACAVGDIDGDGKYEIVCGTGEADGMAGRCYAFHSDGTRVPGWPVAPSSLIPDLIPIVGSGVPGAPLLVKPSQSEGLKVITGGMISNLTMYNADGTVYSTSDPGNYGGDATVTESPCL